MTVVVAHHQEDLSWLEKCKGNKVVVSKTDKEAGIHQPVNRGNEASAYLEYIIRNYDNLDTDILFLHGHEHSFHQDHQASWIVNHLRIPNDQEFFSVNRRKFHEVFSADSPWAEPYNILKENWPWEKELPIPEILKFYSCAQFYVKGKNIQRHQKSLYENMLGWLMNNELDEKVRSKKEHYPARLFEYTWHYIFTGNSCEPELGEEEIFMEIEKF